MRKWLIPCLLFGTLSAQHFENGTLYHSRYVYPQGKGMGHNGQGETRLAVTTPDGRTRVESLPEALDGRRGVCKDVAHHQGVTYAYGILNHPVFDRVGDAYFGYTRGNRSDAMPHAIFRREGKGSWKAWAKVDQSLVGLDLEVFEALEGDRFMVRAMVPYDKRFPAPLCLWVPDGKGGMGGETLPSLAGEDPGFLASCKVVRVQDRFLLIPRSGRGRLVWLDLKGQRSGEGSLQSAFKGMEIASAAPRPDGRVLLRFKNENQFKDLFRLESLLWEKREAASPSERLLKSHLQKEPSPFNMRTLQAGLWAVLDPVSGQITKIQPPLNTRVDEDMAVLPNGNLVFTSSPWSYHGSRDHLWMLWMPNFWSYIMSFFTKGL